MVAMVCPAWTSSPVATPTGVVLCSELAHLPAWGKCAPGAVTAAISLDAIFGSPAQAVWPASPISAARAAQLPPIAFSVATDGAATTIERARALGLSPGAALEQNDAFPFFTALHDLILWGPTGTNVGDVHVVLLD